MADDVSNILNDHYKDSFSHIREREKQRDRLFLLIVALLGTLVLALRYSIALPEALSELSVAGLKIELSKVPLPVIISGTWTFLSILLLRYCQVTIHIEKQYHYLHTLEERLSTTIGESNAISRESAAYYVSKSKCFRHWVWFFYTAIYPAIVAVSIAWSIYLDWQASWIPKHHSCFDTALALISIVTLATYLSALWSKQSSPTDPPHTESTDSQIEADSSV